MTVVSVSRRDFLRNAGLTGLACSAVGTLPDRALASETREVSDDSMGVLVDLTKCIGCRRCEAACKEANGFEVPTDEELREYCAERLARYKVPKEIKILPGLPKGPTGKLLKRELREMVRQESS